MKNEHGKYLQCLLELVNYGGHQLEITYTFSRSFIRVLGSTVIQVVIVHISSLRTLEAGRIAVSRLLRP